MNPSASAPDVTASSTELIGAFVENEERETLRKTLALRTAIFSSSQFSIIATDENGVIQLFNVGAERLLGYRAADVVNRINASDLLDPDEMNATASVLSLELRTPIAQGFEALCIKAARGMEDSDDLTFVCSDGRRVPAIISITALRDEYDTLIGYLLIGADNSARRQVEIELTDAKAIAEKANLAKSDFLSSMSHELRSPLNAILGFAQLMESDPVPQTPTQKESTGQILQAGWYLLDLINEVLDLALVESGKLLLSREAMSFDEVVLDCQAMIEPQAKKYGVDVSYGHFDTSCYVYADRTRVKQILLNLLSNAIKYNHSGGTVKVDCTVRDTEWVRISITDSGPGLSPENLEQLFQPFNRLGRELSGEEGTGIGLVMTKRLVELMGGRIGVESVVDTGSVFWVELEQAVEPELVAGTLDTAESGELAKIDANAVHRTVLYVEDNPANLKLIEQLIARRPDLRLLTATDATLGIKLARDHQPDVILMDINLPGISGIKALHILLADPLTQHIPVVAISANAMPHDIRRGLDAGFFRYLTKPIKVNEFTEVLQTALDSAWNRRAATRDGVRYGSEEGIR
jgi:PAS domain S-box-containing protein